MISQQTTSNANSTPYEPSRKKLIAAELWRRRCRTEFRAFCIEALSLFDQEPARHHHLLIEHLQAVADGRIDRLMVFMPPGSAKSTYGAMLFPGWFMAARPRQDIIGTAYNSEHAEFLSGKCMSFVHENADVLGYHLTSDSRKLWQTSNRGAYRAAGAGGGITGRRADLVIIDDPFKGRAEAESLTERDKIWGWYRAEVITRLKPGGRVVLINTRWHEDDLSGRLLAEMRNATGDKWVVLNLPAIAESEDDQLGRKIGEALWPEWEDVEALTRKRRAIGEREWAALFQQRPAPLEGSLFKVERIMTIPDAPIAHGRIVRAWDLASTAQSGGNDPDWTVGVKMQREPSGRFIVLDVVRIRGTANEVETAIVNTAHADGRHVTIGLPQDPGQAGKSQILYLTNKLAGYPIKSSPETGSKETRAMPYASQVEVGNVAVVDAVWNRTYRDELRAFPSGTHDDQVDASSRAMNMLTELKPGLRISDRALAAAGVAISK